MMENKSSKHFFDVFCYAEAELEVPLQYKVLTMR